MINGQPERILRLTEVFLPKKADEKIYRMMEAYNLFRMPHLRNSHEEHVIEHLEQRKRNIKAELKQATERSKLLQSRINNGIFKPQQRSRAFLHNETVSPEAHEAMLSKGRHAAHRNRLSKLEPLRKQKSEQISIIELARLKRLKQTQPEEDMAAAAQTHLG